MSKDKQTKECKNGLTIFQNCQQWFAFVIELQNRTANPIVQRAGGPILLAQPACDLAIIQKYKEIADFYLNQMVILEIKCVT